MTGMGTEPRQKMNAPEHVYQCARCKHVHEAQVSNQGGHRNIALPEGWGTVTFDMGETPSKTNIVFRERYNTMVLCDVCIRLVSLPLRRGDVSIAASKTVTDPAIDE